MIITMIRTMKSQEKINHHIFIDDKRYLPKMKKN